MGAYCTRALIPRHTAKVDEVMEVLWSDSHGAALFGDRQRSRASRTRAVGSKLWRQQRRHITRLLSSGPDRSSGTSVRSSSSTGSSCRAAPRSVFGISWASSCGCQRV